jgi:acyl-[acyl-carrier-protein] desaturase
MDQKARTDEYEVEVVREMEPFVKERLKYLVGDRRKWWASQYFDFMQGEDNECFRRLKDLRDEARGLSNEELVVLVGNEVTEEALPNYSRRFANAFPDPTGTSQNAWNVWGRGWESEEKQHGYVLDHYLLLSGRVNQEAVLKSTVSLIAGGMKDHPGIFQGLVYPAFQEPATAISHKNMAEIARKRGVRTLYDICINIAGDESRHARFYSDIVAKLMESAPEKMMLAYSGLMKEGVAMPAMNMTDGTYTEPPTLFKHFAAVASRIGVYGISDYADIVDKLNKTFKVADASVSDDAAEAQEHLCELPNRLRKIADAKPRITKPVAFDWIYGSAA